MQTTEIGQKVIAEIRRIAEARPGFTYRAPNNDGHCVYVHGGEGSCIVGRALVNLDLLTIAVEYDTAKVVPSRYNEHRTRVNDSRARAVLPFLGVDASTDELAWIDSVQGEQDNGIPWGEAVACADDYHDMQAA